MKKITIAILSVLLAAALLFSACSKIEVQFVYDDPPTTEAVATTEPPTTEPPTTEPPTTEPPTTEPPTTVPNVNTGND